MELGDHSAECDQRSVMDEALNRLDSALTDVITTIESGGLDQLGTEEKVAIWQRFETIRNKLPLVDHRLIAHADACDLPGSYCSATMMRFLMRAFQLSGAEAASRVRAAAALGPRTSMLGERLESQLPKVAALQADGAVTVEKVAIGTRHGDTGPARVGPGAVNTAEQLLTDYAPVLEPTELKRFALRVVDAADPDWCGTGR